MLYILKSCRTFSKRFTDIFIYYHASSHRIKQDMTYFYPTKSLYCTQEHAGNSNQLVQNKAIEELEKKRERDNSYVLNEIWEEEDFQSPEKRLITNKDEMLDKCKELVSDEESDAEDYALKFSDIDYKILPKRSFRLSYDVVNANSTKQLRYNNIIRIESKNTIGYLMKLGIMPQKIYFSNLSDVLALNHPVNGIRLYKVHEEDLTFWMSSPTKNGMIAIFDKRDIQLKRYNKNDFPVHVIYQGKQTPGFPTQILKSAVVCGCRSVIFVGGRFYSQKLKDNVVALSTMHLDINYFNWQQIEEQFSTDIPVLVIGNDKHTNHLPEVNLYDAEHLTDTGAVVFVSSYINESASSFLSSRNSRQITIPSYLLPEHKGHLPIIFTLCVFELRRKWELMKCRKDKIG